MTPSRKAEIKHEFENLYVRPKSLLRKVIQELFLKSLSKFFPKGFILYKNKIEAIISTIVYYFFRCPNFGLLIIYLKLRHPLYFKLPPKHIYTFCTLIKFLKILEKQKIDFFLLAGSLLGAVRQESFAGRPTDIDLGIKEDQFPKLLNAIPSLIKKGVRSVRKEDKLLLLHIIFRYTLVDIAVFRRKNGMWIGETDKYYGQKFKGITFSIKDLEHLIPIKLYGKKFLAPANPEIYLEKKYGKNWRIPDKKQFAWKK